MSKFKICYEGSVEHRAKRSNCISENSRCHSVGRRGAKEGRGVKKREQSEGRKERETRLIKGTQRERVRVRIQELKWGPRPAKYLLSWQQMAT